MDIYDSPVWQTNHDWKRHLEDIDKDEPGFAPTLDGEFAYRAANYETTEEERKNIQDFARQIMDSRRYMKSDPVRFDEDCLLPGSFHLGNNGTWISLNKSLEEVREREPETVTYHSHNVDTSADIYTFELLFDMWSEAAQIYMD